MWFEELPIQCPPEDAIIPSNEPYYRLINNENNPIVDMISQRYEYPKKIFPIDECTCMSVSIFNNRNSCEAMLKFPRHQHKKVYEFSLSEADGRLKQSFKPNHFSWWRSANFALKNE